MSDFQSSDLGDSASGAARSETPIEALRRLAPEAGDTAGWPPSDHIEDLLKRVVTRVAQVQARCAAVDVFVAAQLDFSSTTDDVEAVYADLQLFARWHRHARPPAPGAMPPGERRMLELQAKVCQRLIESEALLANQMRQWLLFLQAHKETDSALKLFLTQVAAWHAYVRRQLDDIALDVKRSLASETAADARLAGDPAIPLSPQDVKVRLQDLASADALERLSVWSALTALDPASLFAFLKHENNAGTSLLVDTLWPVADLVLIEDQSRHKALLPALGRATGGERWSILAELLEQEAPPLAVEDLRGRFTDRGLEFDDSLAETVWRGLVAVHSRPEIRQRAAEAASLDSLWQVVVYPDASLETIYTVASQVAVRGDDDLSKVFFDCIKSRLMSTLGKVNSKEDLALPARFVDLFFGFGFFIQTRYFEQLEAMLQLLRAQSGRFALTLTGLDRDLHRLEVRRFRAGHPEATEPRSLDRLPLPVQRHLAREGNYLDFFACHGNHLIAREVVPHVNSDNLARFLRLSDLNRQLLEETMRRLDLGGKTDLVLEVLTHPKCPMIFAGKHLHNLSRHQLHRVVRSRSTHSEVKRKSVLQMIKLQGGK